MLDYKFSNLSLERLEKVESRLVEVIKLALSMSNYKFEIVSGLRTFEMQQKIYKSVNMKSRHLPNKNGNAEAVDILIYSDEHKVIYEDQYYNSVAQTFFLSSSLLSIPIEWGGFWKEPDRYHFQLYKG